jgi:hypothetical protein
MNFLFLWMSQLIAYECSRLPVASKMTILVHCTN